MAGEIIKVKKVEYGLLINVGQVEAFMTDDTIRMLSVEKGLNRGKVIAMTVRAISERKVRLGDSISDSLRK